MINTPPATLQDATAMVDTAGFNPTLWAMIGIPLAAVLASLFTLCLAIDGAEPELPPSFATEGQRLDQDFVLREAARRAGVTVVLDTTSPGRISARLQLARGEPAPSRLQLELTHVTDPRRDLQLELLPDGGSGHYASTVAAPLTGRWIARISAPGSWHVIERLELSATAHGNR